MYNIDVVALGDTLSVFEDTSNVKVKPVCRRRSCFLNMRVYVRWNLILLPNSNTGYNCTCLPCLQVR